MKFEFHDDFSGHPDYEHPDGWLIEKHSVLSHGHAYVSGGSYALMLPGNKQIPLTPPMTGFTLDVVCRGDIHFNTVAGIIIYFRYDTEKKQGYYLNCGWGLEGITAVFGMYSRGEYTPVESRKAAGSFDDTSKPFSIHLVAEDFRFELSCGGIALEPFHDSGRTFASGRIALENSSAAGASEKPVSSLGRHVFIDSFGIVSGDDFDRREVWPPLRVEFPAEINGMQKPFVYEIETTETGGCYEMRVNLTGGSPDEPAAYPGSNEELTRPYIRLETAAGVETGIFHLVNGTVGLRDYKGKGNFLFFPADAECPVSAVFRFSELPDDTRLFIGYEFYRHERAPLLQGGPTEVRVDTKTGRILYAGPPLRPGCRIADILSSDDKEICRRIPEDDPRREKSLAFARAGHFFMENEICAFTARLRMRDGTARPAEWTLKASVENVFREPMETKLHCRQRPSEDAFSKELKVRSGVETLTVDIRVSETLPAGVYHLAVRWSEGTRAVVEKRVAFEVMPVDSKSLPAPLASGLPELYIFGHNPVNYFDPWQARSADEGHYMTGVWYPEDFAWEKKIWKTVHAYGRKLQIILKNKKLADYAGLIKEADLVCTSSWDGQVRCDLWKRTAYTGDILSVYSLFVRENIEDAVERKSLTETESTNGVLTKEAFAVLAGSYWKQWLDYFSLYAQKRLGQTRNYVKKINRNALWSLLYALYPPYAAVYKGGYFPLYFGRDVTREPLKTAGPFFLEDYPYNTGYYTQRGAYQLASMKMTAPGQKIYPELFAAAIGCPGDSALLFGHPPYGVHYVPPLYLRKQLFEFAYSAVWFGKDGFSYWKDYGFHACNTWQSEHFAELLRTWAAVRGAPPLKPLRATAFGFSLAACRRHPDYHEPEKKGMRCSDMYNTAEECTAYAYEQARLDGQPAGFLLDMEHAGNLNPEDVSTLVLPPLTGVSADILEAIRKKHKQGINLVGFEDVTGLEDLFGVSPMSETVAVRSIRLDPDSVNEKHWAELYGLSEECSHPLCRTRYKLKGGKAILEGFNADGNSAVPVLVTRRTKHGRTALFCVPPTVVNRADQKERVQYGQECLSRLMNRSMALILRLLGSPAAETTAGKLIAFRDTTGCVRVIVMEDAWPETPRTIEPRVTVHLPGICREDIACDRPFSILEIAPGRVSVRLRLEPHDSCMLTFKGGMKK